MKNMTKKLRNQEWIKINKIMNKFFYNTIVNFLCLIGVYTLFSISEIKEKVFIELHFYKIILILIFAVFISLYQYKKNKNNDSNVPN